MSEIKRIKTTIRIGGITHDILETLTEELGFTRNSIHCLALIMFTARVAQGAESPKELLDDLEQEFAAELEIARAAL